MPYTVIRCARVDFTPRLIRKSVAVKVLSTFDKAAIGNKNTCAYTKPFWGSCCAAAGARASHQTRHMTSPLPNDSEATRAD
ncbi:unnamed protein product [Arctia plantaginis]|uniref:Uncharacterized protein n=1 Tax=Arctia plantaginis TaxID=874455 RepID=A0A8S0Z9Q8_ARCPL|nr:unnamed protein product [Arctia plantaginis]CAB3261850.1 unnamed protein product [Arctia plantaginis]